MDTPSEIERVDRGLWQISVLGSECLDQRSSRRSWIGDRESGSTLVADWRAWIGVLGSAFFSPCLDWSSSRRAWIGDRESGSALVADRHAWIGVLLAVLGSETERVDRRLWQISVLGSKCLDRRSSYRAWIGVLLGAMVPTWIEISESLE